MGVNRLQAGSRDNTVNDGAVSEGIAYIYMLPAILRDIHDGTKNKLF